MIHYQATMRHDEKTFQALAHMQYDLFCKKNLIMRSLLSFAAMAAGIINFSQWWGVLLIVYGSYLTTSKYAQANHTAGKLVKGIKAAGLDFPVSRYLFRDNAMEIITMPENTALGDPLMYSDVLKLGEDGDYFYLFRDQFGGYMIPKEEMGEEVDDFRFFVEQKVGKTFQTQIAPVFKLIRRIDSQKRKSRQQ
ncbi:MAG: YcxB family protein [Clostridia bacterium]|nr:YcxB family protein [Clostridia bacterium]MBQ9950834.1 YcxB family protein [Clostridia bacterium]